MNSSHDQTAHPVYAEKAKLVSGTDLYRRAGVSHDAIAAIAKCHANTVRGAIAGKSKQYQKAHDTFTALNSLLHSSFSRAEYVLYEDENGNFVNDPELERTVVFIKLKDSLAKERISASKLSAISGVDILTVEDAIKRKPIDKNMANAIGEAIVKLKIQFDPDIDLVR